MNWFREDLPGLFVITGHILLMVGWEFGLPLGWRVLLGLAGGILFFQGSDNFPSGTA